MKVVLLALGSRGDVQPMVALGRELAGRGLPVTVVAMRDYAGLVDGAGLDFAPIERSMTESVISAAGPSGRVSSNPIAYIRGASRWLAGIAPQVMAAELAAVQPDDLVVAGLLNIDDGATLREITVSTSVHSDADTVEICVQDTGHGISPEDKDRLFLPHFSTKNRGTGLGLAIAARIVAEHGGTIHVEDNFPVGSRFLVELPSAEPATAAVTERNGVEAT